MKFTMTEEIYSYLKKKYGGKLYAPSSWIGEEVQQSERGFFYSMGPISSGSCLFWVRSEPGASEEFTRYLRQRYPEFFI